MKSQTVVFLAGLLSAVSARPVAQGITCHALHPSCGWKSPFADLIPEWATGNAKRQIGDILTNIGNSADPGLLETFFGIPGIISGNEEKRDVSEREAALGPLGQAVTAALVGSGSLVALNTVKEGLTGTLFGEEEKRDLAAREAALGPLGQAVTAALVGSGSLVALNTVKEGLTGTLFGEEEKRDAAVEKRDPLLIPLIAGATLWDLIDSN